MTDPKAINAAIKDVRAGMGTRSAATKHGLTRDTLRYWLQKRDAERARFARAIQQEKEQDGSQKRK